jgi:hypothetical protein
MMRMTAWPLLTRRRLLAGAAAVVAVGAAGCTMQPPAPPPPDPLEPLLVAALADADLADAVAVAHPRLADVSRALASDRRAHAASLRAEIRRATPSPAPSSSTSGTTAPAVAVPVDAAAAATALAEATRAAADQARRLVSTVPRYRAGLVASVSACCASHLAVLR